MNLTTKASQNCEIVSPNFSREDIPSLAAPESGDVALIFSDITGAHSSVSEKAEAEEMRFATQEMTTKMNGFLVVAWERIRAFKCPGEVPLNHVGCFDRCLQRMLSLDSEGLQKIQNISLQISRVLKIIQAVVVLSAIMVLSHHMVYSPAFRDDKYLIFAFVDRFNVSEDPDYWSQFAKGAELREILEFSQLFDCPPETIFIRESKIRAANWTQLGPYLASDVNIVLRTLENDLSNHSHVLNPAMFPGAKLNRDNRVCSQKDCKWIKHFDSRRECESCQRKAVAAANGQFLEPTYYSYSVDSKIFYISIFGLCTTYMIQCLWTYWSWSRRFKLIAGLTYSSSISALISANSITFLPIVMLEFGDCLYNPSELSAKHIGKWSTLGYDITSMAFFVSVMGFALVFGLELTMFSVFCWCESKSRNLKAAMQTFDFFFAQFIFIFSTYCCLVITAMVLAILVSSACAYLFDFYQRIEETSFLLSLLWVDFLHVSIAIAVSIPFSIFMYCNYCLGDRKNESNLQKIV